MDAGDVIVHLMSAEAREFYDLENDPNEMQNLIKHRIAASSNS